MNSKNIVKKSLTFLLIVVVFSFLLMVFPMLMPHSQQYKDMLAAGPSSPSAAVYLFICSAVICCAICFIAANSNWRGMKRFVGITFVIYMTVSFMMQIETLFFGSAFPALTRVDVLLIMLGQLPAIAVGTLLSIKYFGNKEPVAESVQIPVATFVPRIAVIGFIYTVVYMLFGYYVFLQIEGTRTFYSIIEDASFIVVLMNNDPIIYPFQILRGIMFASFLLPLFYMQRDQGRKKFIVSVCLTYLTTPALLIIPNPLMPDFVRWGHFIEMLSSMLLFGIITGLILYMPGKSGIVE